MFNTFTMKFTAFHSVVFFVLVCLFSGLMAFAQEPVKEEKERLTPAQEVLGRKLTDAEKELYANLSSDAKADALKNDILLREQKLVVVRALIALGEAANASEILPNLHYSEAKTYKQLVQDFSEIREKHGSVKQGIESTVRYRVDDEKIFEGTALKAYKIVYGVDEGKLTNEEKNQLYNKFKSREALKYTHMIETLVKGLTEEDKSRILYGILDEIGREDLKKNDEFVDKLIAQDFTYESMKKLLQEVK